ncbi:MAG TPA: MBL fold metallo-hydrolase [Gaiellaceae bacterium]|nr:MBL fold metallo-hydrolase [Gaiellaceae bacterium]
MREVRPGVWHWEAPHPDWKPGEAWDELVSSYAIDDGGRLLLFDPLAVPGEIEALAGERETAIVLTCPWHERDTRRLVRRLGAAVFVPQLEEGEPIEGRHWFSAGDRLPIGVQAFPGFEPDDVVLWVESHGAIVAGDTLIDRGNGLEIPVEWLREGVTRDEVAKRLRPVLELPVEHVLATHGGPTDRGALERALS